MLPYQSQGRFSPQAHVAIPEGLYEEEHGRDGFYGPVSHVYHRHAPTGWSAIEGPLRPVAVDTRSLAQTSEDGIRVWLLTNTQIRLGICRQSEASPAAYRNADGDELWFIHAGQGALQTDYGWLDVSVGDYVLLPKGCTYRWYTETPLTALLIESRGRIDQPERGLLGQHALYDPGVLQMPALREAKPSENLSETGDWTVDIQRNDQLTRLTYPFNPLDVAGWKGTLYPCRLSMADIRPVNSHRMHLAPSIHSTWVMPGAVVCTFLPRPLEEEPEALRVPFYHRNIDYDECIFYHAGDFFSRDGIAPGMITWHPAGIHHGPHPKAIAASRSKTHTQEQAVMLDTREPLQLTEVAQSLQWADYWQSWQA